jgi:hypothetical protein
MNRNDSANALMELAVQTHAHVSVARPAPRKTAALAKTLSRRKFIAAAALVVDAFCADASLCLTTLDTVDFIDDALEEYGPVRVSEK